MAVVRLILPQGGAEGWHADLLARLRLDGRRAFVAWGAPPRRSLGLALALALEGVLYGREDAPAAAFETSFDSADFTFDLTGAGEPPPGAYAPSYDGDFSDGARDLALLSGRAPDLALARAGEPPALRARPAVERDDRLLEGRKAVAAALRDMIVKLVGAGALGVPAPVPETSSPRAPLAFAAAGLAAAVTRKIKRLAAREANWRIGWRGLRGGPPSLEALAWPKHAAWQWLPDDADGYFADPFAFTHQGREAVFCEEFPYRTGRGVISVFTLDEDGRASKPRIVLERPHHLSYPFVFAWEGAVWMLPESSGAGVLELFRCEAFPDRWALEGAVVSGRCLADATPFAFNGGWVLMAASNAPGESTWDTLSIFRAPSPLGPWVEDPGGPVLIDSSSARPAGAVQMIGGALWRPAQDCRAGYGAGLALCRIDSLEPGRFAQSVAARLTPPQGSACRGVHTLNVGGGREFIDALGPWPEEVAP